MRACLTHTFAVYSVVPICLGQARAHHNATEPFESHHSSCATPAGLLGTDAISPSVKIKAVDNPEPGIGCASPRSYGGKRVAKLSIVNVSQQFLAEREGSIIDFLVIGRCRSNTDGSCIAVNQNDHFFL